MFKHTCLFLTFRLAFLAVCDDEQAGGEIAQLEVRQMRHSTEGDTEDVLGLVYTSYLCHSLSMPANSHDWCAKYDHGNC